MIDNDKVAAYIRRFRHTAKFTAISHSNEFIDAAADLGEGFYTAHIYDEQINANLITTKYGMVLIDNTYIASFAFNLFLCWLGNHTGAFPNLSLDKLLAHNFKKFFAEQIYRQANRIQARALLLETLLFEQVMMVDVFAAKTRDQKLSADADAATSLMSLALATHELGHFYLKTKPGLWAELLLDEPETVGTLYAEVLANHPENFVIEFQCDTYAVLACLRQFERANGPLFALRAIVFAFAAYAAMYSAAATAKATGEIWDAAFEAPIDFLDISTRPKVLHDTEWAIDKPFIQRAHLVQMLCERLAAKRGLELFGSDDPFPLPATIIEDFLRYVGRVFDCDDDNARKMSNLVAQSLYGHDAGMEYMYLRSKTFRSNRPERLKVQ